MRLIYSLPKQGDQLSHDSPLLKIIRLAVPAFILISAVTVFLGVRAHISDYLAYYPAWVQYPALSVGFALFSLAPDLLNSILVAYVARTILKRKFDHLSIILVVFCAVLSVGLTIYSFQMSKFSAVEAANEASGEAKTIDLSLIDQKRDAALQRIQDDYNSEKQTIESNYAALIETENQAIAAREKQRTDANTLWIDKQQSRHRKEIAKLLEKQKSDLEALRSRKQAKEDETGAQHQKDRAKTESDNTAKEAKHNNFAAIFADKLSWLAGNAVFVVLILTCIREILYNRNGVEIKPVFGQFDFQPSPVLETLSYPFTFAGRHIINKVRKAYAALPSLEERPDFAPITDYSGYEQEIKRAGGKKQAAPPQPVAPEEKAEVDDIWRDLSEDAEIQKLFGDNGFSQNSTSQVAPVAPVTSATLSNPQRITIRGFQPFKVQSIQTTNGDRINGDRNNGKTKGCKHCGNHFEYKHWNAQYCSDDCRIAAWEKRTGKAFKKPTTKKRKGKK